MAYKIGMVKNMKKLIFFLLIMCLLFVLTACSTSQDKKEISVNSSNYVDYFSIQVECGEVCRSDGSKIHYGERRDDARMPFKIKVVPKNGVTIKRLDVSLNVKFHVVVVASTGYTKSTSDQYKYMACDGMTFSELVTSYSWTYQCPRMCYCTFESYTIRYSMEGVVLA